MNRLNPVFRTELELEDAFLQFLAINGWCAITQVPCLGRSIDVVFWRKNSTQYIAAELKLRNWQKALSQACILKHATELVFIVLPDMKDFTKVVDNAKHLGVGVIAVDKRNSDTEHSWKILTLPNRNRLCVNVAKRELVSSVRSLI